MVWGKIDSGIKRSFARPLLKKYAVAFSVLVVAVAIASFGSSPVSAAPNQIDGTIYWDQNNNGVRDVGEPGIPGVVVTYGFPPNPAVTDANGNNTISGVSGTGRVTVHSGWYRSQCNSMNCAAGPGVDNDLPVANQIITLGAVNGAAGATFDVGLVPDWGGTYPIPAPPLSSNPVDVALRTSFLVGSCADVSSARACNVGETPTLFVTAFNQGTSSLSGIEFLVELPVGHTLDDSSWRNPNDVNNYAHPDANSVTVLEGYDPAKGYGRYRINGTLPAGANTSLAFDVNITNAAFPSPTPYPTSDPYDKQGIARIVAMDQTGDWDSSFCEVGGPNDLTGTCDFGPLGIHDKTQPLDHSDGAGWAVTGTYVAPVYDPALQIVLAPGQPNPTQAGSQVNFIVRLCNNGTGDAVVRNLEIQNTVPDGMSFNPADNPQWTASGDILTTFWPSQIMPGQCVEIPLVLTINPNVTPDDNGTPLLLDNAEIVSFTTSRADALGAFLTATDSDPDNNYDSVDITVATTPDPDPSPSPNPGANPDDPGLADTGISRILVIVLAALLVAPLIASAVTWLLHKRSQGTVAK